MKELRQVLLVFTIAIYASIPTSSWASPELMEAISSGDLEEAKALVQAGADINYFTDIPVDSGCQAKVTPLCLAVMVKRPKIVEWLLSASADTQIKCVFGPITKTPYQCALVMYDESSSDRSSYRSTIEHLRDRSSSRAIIAHLLKDRSNRMRQDPHEQYYDSPNSAGFALALNHADPELIQVFLKHSPLNEFIKRHSGFRETLTELMNWVVGTSLQAERQIEGLTDAFECLNIIYLFPKEQESRERLIDSSILRESFVSSSLCASQSTPASTPLHPLALMPMDVLKIIYSYEEHNSKNSKELTNFNERLNSLKKANEAYDVAKYNEEQAENIRFSLEEAVVDLNSELRKLYRFQVFKKRQLQADLSKAKNALEAAEVELIRISGLNFLAGSHRNEEQKRFKTFIGEIQKQLND